ncbi:MAG TPA: tRNA preQ1(34) S-adenosylmethionine ribosyltransferase-isomerase QueA [Planctomycetota bacterium]|nr:tRNA preQ1(34) S-adenosylmethionine ribosyltransferase-isomerase QueA [Planctomycetota bacterium]
MKLSDFDYHLPPGMIAQRPTDRREASRLLVLHRADARIEHRRFTDVARYLEARDVLVLNDTRVLPWKVTGRRATGGRIEGLLLEARPDGTWLAIFKSHGTLLPRERLRLLDRRLTAHLVAKDDEGIWTIRFDEDDAADVLARSGYAPLPPYIRRAPDDDSLAELDRERYQTVFAEKPGAIAAPTAGLHFTESLLADVRASGVDVVTVTLHVGMGTFQPVKTEDLDAHRMHSERFSLGVEAAGRINARRHAGGRVVAVGTTTVRVLESCADDSGRLAPHTASTDLFIHPPYTFRAVDAMVTNFHLPKSTLLMLVSAFATREMILAAYEEAKREGYRFFSYGDAMLIL